MGPDHHRVFTYSLDLSVSNNMESPLQGPFSDATKNYLHGRERSRTKNGHVQVQVQDTRLRMPNKWHICKEGQAGNKSRQLLVFSELPSLPSAGSRPGSFHTSLGCMPRSLIRVSLGCSIIQKILRRTIQLRLIRQ
jgi:hypothetical protein